MLSEIKYCTKPYPFAKPYNAMITTKLGTNPGFLSQRYCHPLLIVGPIALREKCESTNDIFFHKDRQNCQLTQALNLLVALIGHFYYTYLGTEKFQEKLTMKHSSLKYEYEVFHNV